MSLTVVAVGVAILMLFALLIRQKMSLWIKLDSKSHLFTVYILLFGIRIRLGRKKKRKRRQVSSYLPQVLQLVKSSRISALELDVAIGLGDAAADAIVAGSIRIGVTSLCAAIGYDTLPRISITPLFGDVDLAVRLDARLAFKIKDVLYTIGRILIKKIKGTEKNK